MKTSRRTGVLTMVALMITICAVSTSAQARIEANLNWPITIGINTSNTLFSGSSIDLSQYHFLLPDFRIYYQFGGEDLVRGGIGVRAYSLIIQSFIYPEAFVELNLAPIELEASLGGYVFGFFGLYNNLTTASLLLPDLSVGWQIIPWLRLGGGFLLFVPTTNWSQNFVYMGYIGARFIFLPKEAEAP